MKYGVYLTIDGGEDLVLVGLYRSRLKATKAMYELSEYPEKVAAQAHRRNVTCLEVINRHNMMTYDFIQLFLEDSG